MSEGQQRKRHERVVLFHPEKGLGLEVAAGSGRSWMEMPDGDPRMAHLEVDGPGQYVGFPPEPARWRSMTGFIAWDGLLAFAGRLEDLEKLDAGEASLDGVIAGPIRLTIRLREDGLLQAEVAFRTWFDIEIDVVARTRWDEDAPHREHLPVVAREVRAAVASTRPPRHR